MIDKFIVVANILAEDDGKAILEGNSRVLRSRLNDAKFFFEKDIKIIKSKGLLSLKEKLKNVTFHNKIGSQFDRINKIEKLSLKIAHLISADSIKCQKAANLCKNDLVSQVVTEFPELQGTVGKIYADLDGTDIDISNAIAEHYLPVKQDDKVPLNPISIVVSISDKINTLICFGKLKKNLLDQDHLD